MKKIFLIINFRTIVISILAVVSTYVCIRFDVKADFPLTLIATAIIFPIVFSINGAYKRREKALSNYGSIKSHGRAIYFAARDWLENPSDELLEKTKTLLGDLLVACRVLFTDKTENLRRNEDSVYEKFSDISKFIKNDLRGNGLASGEVSRCNQFLSKMFVDFESAKHIYQYRTPRTLRTFSTIFITLLPILYGPYFAFEAVQYSPQVSYMLPVLFSVVLVSLSNIQAHLENPFDKVGEDDISLNVEQFLERLYR